jgi:hypothetical protein
VAADSARSDLFSQIKELQSDFQRVASDHTWICLYVPPCSEQFCMIRVGEKAPGPIIPQLELLGVATPRDTARCVVVDHVDQLTFRAIELLKRVLKNDLQVPRERLEIIRDAESQMPVGYGWVHWMWYATRIQHVCRFEHYPQVAATALFELANHVRPRGNERRGKGSSRRGPRAALPPVNIRAALGLWPKYQRAMKPKRAFMDDRFVEWLKSKHIEVKLGELKNWKNRLRGHKYRKQRAANID